MNLQNNHVLLIQKLSEHEAFAKLTINFGLLKDIHFISSNGY